MKIDFLLLSAVILDLIFGDPDFIPHPVVLMGKMISGLEKTFKKLLRKSQYLKEHRAVFKSAERAAGFLEVVIVVGTVYLFTLLIIKLAFLLHYWLGIVVTVCLLQSTIALKGLVEAGREVFDYLEKGELKSARRAVNMIVGRDCSQMNEKEVIRAVVETLAENTSDGILAPVFFYLLGGVPLVFSYKAVNTLDSMLGYKNEKYKFYGWAAARLDDLANLIPARITGTCLCLAAGVSGQDFRGAVKIMLRDARKHPSPNAGYPEGAAAGALGLRLGGTNYYDGHPSFRAYLGDKVKDFAVEDITTLIRMIYFTLGIFLAGVVVLKIAVTLYA